jgi:phosphatidylglycerol---prolipoprotein diacylglyceryl transferase
MITWWQNLPLHLDPYIFSVGFLQLHWYGFMYVVALSVTGLLAFYRYRRGESPYGKEIIYDFLFWGVIGLFIGARVGYVLIYNFRYFVGHPLEIFGFSTVSGFVGFAGMSYHGGLIGVIVATWIFLKKNKVDFWDFSDVIVPCFPLAYMFGRLGNFINNELYGRETDSIFGMYFRGGGDRLRHPSQLYEAFFEGFVLFIIFWLLRNRRGLKGLFLGLYIVGYAIARFVVEYWRLPDEHIGFVFGSFSMGQILSVFMIFLGVIIVYMQLRSPEVDK